MFDYKKIFRNRAMREAIMRFLNFLPDKTMLKLEYRIKTGRKLNLKSPKRYTEKIQWYKLNYRVPLMTQITDKYDVRDYVESKGQGDILNGCYGVYDSFEDIDFSKLPNSFVLKDTLGSGSVSVIVVKDKSTMDFESVKKQSKKWVSKKNAKLDDGREWAYYSGKKHRIIVDNYLVQPDGDLVDYKFLCFGGKPQYIVYDKERFSGHKRNFYDTEWNYIKVDSDCPCFEDNVPKPENLNKMLEIAACLSADFPAVRVDLYNVSGKIYFGELTCYPWSGLVQFDPDSFDFDMGEKFVLPPKTITK